MAEFKKKDKYSFWYSPLALIVLLGLLFFLFYKVIDLIKKDKETGEKKELILDKIDELKERERILNEDIAKMQTEEGIEDVIRGKYKVVKEGEKMVTIIDEEKVTQKQTEEVDHSFVGWLKGLFKR